MVVGEGLASVKFVNNIVDFSKEFVENSAPMRRTSLKSMKGVEESEKSSLEIPLISVTGFRALTH